MDKPTPIELKFVEIRLITIPEIERCLYGRERTDEERAADEAWFREITCPCCGGL